MMTAIANFPGQRKRKSVSAPIRVSFMIDNLSRAGTESQLLALIRALDPRRIQSTLVLLDGQGDESRALEPANCPVLRLGVRKLFSRRAWTASGVLSRFWHLTRPDVVQAYFMDSAYLGVPVARNCGVRRVVRVRNNLGYWLTRKHRTLNRLLQPLVDRTITNSDDGREALIAADGLAPGRVAVIENGVDLARFPAVELSGDTRFRIGCVANLRGVKNIDGLMRAAAMVLKRYPHALFEVAGEGGQRPALEALLASLGLGDRFVLRGSVADIPAFLRAVSIVVLPSHSEGMSNAVLEAMAAGRAVIATDVGANAKLLSDGERGLIVPPRDDRALANAILCLLDDHDLAMRLAMAARCRVEADHSRDAMRSRFEQFYESLLK